MSGKRYTRDTLEDFKPDQFRDYPSMPDTLEEFFEYDSLHELHEETGHEDLEQTYLKAKSNWGDLMWTREPEFLNLEIVPEIPIDFNNTEIKITPIKHRGEVYERTYSTVRSDQKKHNDQGIPTYAEQGFWIELPGSLSHQMDDMDWAYDEHGFTVEDIEGEETINLVTFDEMEKSQQMGSAQYGLSNYLPEPLERDWLEHQDSAWSVALSGRSIRIGDILANQAERTDSDTIKAYVGAGHIMGIYSTIKEHNENDEVPEIEFRHGKSYQPRNPLRKEFYTDLLWKGLNLNEKRKME